MSLSLIMLGNSGSPLSKSNSMRLRLQNYGQPNGLRLPPTAFPIPSLIVPERRESSTEKCRSKVISEAFSSSPGIHPSWSQDRDLLRQLAVDDEAWPLSDLLRIQRHDQRSPVDVVRAPPGRVPRSATGRQRSSSLILKMKPSLPEQSSRFHR